MPVPIVAYQTIVKGDDYKVADGRALTWSSPEWPDLHLATLKMVAGPHAAMVYGTLPITWTSAALSGASPLHTATLELTHAETALIQEGTWFYTLTATLTDGDVVTLATGQLTVIAAPGEEPLAP